MRASATRVIMCIIVCNGVACGTHVFTKLKFANNIFRPIRQIECVFKTKTKVQWQNMDSAHLSFFVYLFVSGESGLIWIVKMAAVMAFVNQNIGENLAFSRVIDKLCDSFCFN